MDDEKPPIPLSVDPNIYAITGVFAEFTEEEFLIQIISGFQVKKFLASPKHAKRIYLLLKQSVEQFEQKFGELKTALPLKPKTTQNEQKIGF